MGGLSRREMDCPRVSIPWGAIKWRWWTSSRLMHRVSIPWGAIKCQICGRHLSIPQTFQFREVRLNGRKDLLLSYDWRVSIPWGAIKCELASLSMNCPIWFQFREVRLNGLAGKYDSHQSRFQFREVRLNEVTSIPMLSYIRVSIPWGAIKCAMQKGRVSSTRVRFNSVRCD